jgi:polyisoprenyl-teichoic acid--peptidoglycan teichoic acid transferase
MSMSKDRRRVRRTKKGSIGKKLLAVVALMVLVVVAILGASIITFFSGLRSGLTPDEGLEIPAPLAGERINILVLGVDVPLDSRGNVNYNIPTRSDTIMLATVDLQENTISVLSVPRDTRVEIPGRNGYYKVNSAHVYGGPALVVKTVSQFLEVPIHYYVRTNVEGFSKIVDILGGVKIDVEKDMYYKDIYQDLLIDIKAGLQVLDGESAMGYVRYRSDGNDITRIGRQQKFLAAVADELLEITTLFKLPRLAGEVVKHIDTNMQAGDMMGLARIVVGASAESIEMNVVPGAGRMVGGASYWIADMKATQEIVDRQVWGIDRTMNAQIRVEVLNGTETRGLATTVARMLSDRGFNVVRIDNADKQDYAETRVIAYSDDETKVAALSRVFNHGTLSHENGGSSEVDIAIIVGQDFIR